MKLGDSERGRRFSHERIQHWAGVFIAHHAERPEEWLAFIERVRSGVAGLIGENVYRASRTLTITLCPRGYCLATALQIASLSLLSSPQRN